MSTAQFTLDKSAAAGARQGVSLPRHTPPAHPAARNACHALPLAHRLPGHALAGAGDAAPEALRSYFPSGLPLPPRTQAVLVLRLECLESQKFSELSLDRLRFI